MTGEELKATRYRLGYSLTALSRATGYGLSQIARYQSGEQKIPAKFALSVGRLPPLAKG